MKPLQEIQNYILIHNGEVVTTKIDEEVEVSGHKITVKQATNLQVIYTGDCQQSLQTEIVVTSPTLDLMETFSFTDDITYQRKLSIDKNVQVTRFVNHVTTGNHKITIEDFVEIAEDAKIACAYVDFSDTNNESKYTYHLVGENANAKIRLATLSKQEEKKHFEVHVCHLAPYTTGIMDNYGVVKDKARLHIDGIGTIKRGNHQSNNQQINKILVFNPESSAIANPYLYIDEYDVNAGHGASVGKVDEDQLYYLQARGLRREEALHLITYGYFMPVLEFIKNEEVREQFRTLLKEKVGI